MNAAPDNNAARLQFYERLVDSEMFLLLQSEPSGDQVKPEIFDTDDGRFTLVFDREDRLTSFTGAAAPYAALSGRDIVTMLAGQDVGIGLNLGVAPSSFLLPADALSWLNDTLAARPSEIAAMPREVRAPTGS